jgi:hypothetical protein
MTVSEKKPRHTTRMVVAGPGALAAVLLIGAVAFGASSLRGPSPAAPESAGGAVADVAKAERPSDARPYPAKGDPKSTAKPKPSEKPKDKGKEEPKEEAGADAPKATEKPADKPKAEAPKPADKPKPADQPKATPKPQPAPANPVALALEGWTKETKVKLAWKPYGGDGFEYYKVVRSSDGTVIWPAGADDTVVGVIGDKSAAWWADVPPCGTPWTYRVFAVRHGDAGYVTLGATNAVTLKVTCAPDPTPVAVVPLALEVQVKPGEGIALSWEKCTSEHFAAYKVVRSKTNPDPRYPLNDGAELIAAIGDPGQTTFVDVAVEAGEAWTYRVVAVTSGPSGHVAIGQTAAMSATAQ